MSCALILKRSIATYWFAKVALIFTAFASALTVQEIQPTFDAEVTILPVFVVEEGST